MKNLIKRLGSGRGWSMSNNEDGSNHNEKQPVQQQQQRTSKRYSRRQQQQQDQHRNRHSQQREESRSDSKSPGHRHQHHYQQSPRESGVRDLFHFSSSGEQPPQMPFQQPRHQAVFRTTDTSYGSQQQLSSGDTFHYDEKNQQHFNSYHHHHQSQQPSQHEHYPRDFEHVGFAQSTSPLSFYGPGASPANSHIRTPQQQHHHHHFDFDRNGANCFNPDEDNCRVRFLSSSSSVSSSFSEEPSQVHMMAGCGQSVASSSCMSGSSSYLFESASKRTSKGDLAVFDKVVRGVMHEEDERLCAMGMMSINQDGTTPGRTSPEQQWATPTSLSRMRNEEFEAGVDCEYHDVRDEEIHHHSASPLPSSSARASAATQIGGPPSDDNMDNQKRSEEQNEFSMTSISKWSSSYFR
mmetsp:Transcript_1281/g.2085  ORF Transcript_1281/g.2085 Transcript_1281/m.2085 type:complete len:408 (+) Transcript_1281:278-1501(+)